MIRLDLGAGPVSPAGFVPLGRAHGSEIYPLPYGDDSVDEIRASHVLEHFPHGELEAVIADWVRALKPGGRLRVAVPDFGAIARAYASGARLNAEGYLMGGQVDSDDFHKALFDRDRLRQLLASADLVLLRPWQSELAEDCAALPVSLNLEGTKPRRRELIVRGVMTSPRLGFNDMWVSAITALPKLGIELTNVSGAFWDQCLTQALERVVDEADYLLTIDYDSVFHAGHVAQLLQLAMLSEADAIAPIQASRHSPTPLGLTSILIDSATSEGEHMLLDAAELERDLMPARQAHFGLTMIRADRLRDLPQPWFRGVPNDAGKWSEGKTDPDIYFWRQWERAGCSLYLAPRVVIGHLELMVRWPGTDMLPIWQSAKDWGAARQAPAGVWTGEAE
jgi:hypothetical protein